MDELEVIVNVLGRAVETQDNLLNAAQALMRRLLAVEDDVAELRDELYALSNRIESLTQVVNGRRP